MSAPETGSPRPTRRRPGLLPDWLPVWSRRGSYCATLELAPLALRHAAADTEALVVGEGVLDAQTRLASRVEPPFSGKKASGSVCAHRARSCHARGPSSTSSPPPKRSDSTSASGSSGCFSGPSPRMFHMPASLRSELLASKNYMRVRQGQSSRGGKLHPLVTVDIIP